MPLRRTEDLFGDELGDGFQIGEGTAGGDACVFKERGVEKERAAVDEGMIRRFEGLATAPASCGVREDAFIELQVGLKLQRGSHIPVLLASECREEFAAEGRGVFAGERFGFAIFLWSRDRALADEIERLGAHGEERFALEQSE